MWARPSAWRSSINWLIGVRFQLFFIVPRRVFWGGLKMPCFEGVVSLLVIGVRFQLFLIRDSFRLSEKGVWGQPQNALF